MNQKIEVLVDIYPPIFSETTQYQYANIRAVNPDGNSPLSTIERNRKCFLNIS